MRDFVLSAAAAVAILALVLIVLMRRRGAPLPKSRTLAIAAGIAYGVLGRLLFGLAYSKWDPDLPIWVTPPKGRPAPA